MTEAGRTVDAMNTGNRPGSVADTAYVVGSLGDDGFHIDRIYLDREEAERFVEAHNAVDYNYAIEEYLVGAPADEYDGPHWKAEWHEGWLVTPSHEDPSDPYSFKPFWSEERLHINSEWYSGKTLPVAEFKIRRTDRVPALITAHGSSKDAVERLMRDAVDELKAVRGSVDVP